MDSAESGKVDGRREERVQQDTGREAKTGHSGEARKNWSEKRGPVRQKKRAAKWDPPARCGTGLQAKGPPPPVPAIAHTAGCRRTAARGFCAPRRRCHGCCPPPAHPPLPCAAAGGRRRPHSLPGQAGGWVGATAPHQACAKLLSAGRGRRGQRRKRDGGSASCRPLG